MFACSAAAFPGLWPPLSAELPDAPSPTPTPGFAIPSLRGGGGSPSLLTWDSWTHFCFWRKGRNWDTLSLCLRSCRKATRNQRWRDPIERVMRFPGGCPRSAPCQPSGNTCSRHRALSWLTGAEMKVVAGEAPGNCLWSLDLVGPAVPM